MGIDVYGNMRRVISEYDKRRKLGIKITAEQIEREKEYIKALREKEKAKRREAIVEAGKPSTAIKERFEAFDKLRLQEAKINAQLAIGRDIERNRIDLLKVYQSMRRLGVHLGEKRLAIEKEITKEIREREKVSRLEKYKRELVAAKSITNAIAKRWEINRKLNVTIERATTELKAGLNVEQNRKAILDAINKKRKLGIYIEEDLLKKEIEINRQLKIRAEISKFERFREQVSETKAMASAIAEMSKGYKKLRVAEEKSYANIKLGRREEEERIKLIKTYTSMQKLGVTLSEKQLSRLREQRSILKKQVGGEVDVKASITAQEAETEAMARRIRLMRDLANEEQRNIANIRMGIDKYESMNAILDIYEKKQKLGINLTREQVRRKEELVRILKKQEALEHKVAVEEARRGVDVEKERLKIIRKLEIEEAKYNAARRQGFNVEEARRRFMEEMNTAMRAGIRLTKLQRAELEKFNKEQEKLKFERGDTFLSPQWLKRRARWFIQLRGFWAIWRGMQETFTTVRELETAFANLQAITKSTDVQLLAMKDTLKGVATSMSVNITTIAEGMVKLGQAGLSATETTEVIKDVAKLSVATMSDIGTSADLVTTAMRAWKLEAKDSSYIIDTLANTVNRSKVTIQGLGQALQYVTGVAPQVNLSFKETAAMIGTLANQGIRMSKTGTGIRALLGELLRPSKRFKDELHKLGLTMQEVDINARGVFPVLETLADAGFDATEAFKSLDRRAASAISALIANAHNLRDFADNLGEAGSASEMATRQMEALNAQTTIMKNKFAVLASTIFDRYKNMLKVLVKSLASIADELNALPDAAKKFFDVLGDTAILSVIVLLVHWLFKALSASKLIVKVWKGLQAVAVGAFTGWGLAVTILGGLVFTYLKYVEKTRFEVEKLSAKYKEVQKEILVATSKQDEFNNTAAKYKEALRSGNSELAERIALQNESLNIIHRINESNDERLAAIENQNKKYSESIKLLEKQEELIENAYIRERAAAIKPKSRFAISTSAQWTGFKYDITHFEEVQKASGRGKPTPGISVAQKEKEKAIAEDRKRRILEINKLYKEYEYMSKNRIDSLAKEKKSTEEIVATIERKYRPAIKELLTSNTDLAERIMKGNKVFFDRIRQYAREAIASAKVVENVGKNIQEISKEPLKPATKQEQKTIARSIVADLKKNPEFAKFTDIYGEQFTELVRLIETNAGEATAKLKKISDLLTKSAVQWKAEATDMIMENKDLKAVLYSELEASLKKEGKADLLKEFKSTGLVDKALVRFAKTRSTFVANLARMLQAQKIEQVLPKITGKSDIAAWEKTKIEVETRIKKLTTDRSTIAGKIAEAEDFIAKRIEDNVGKEERINWLKEKRKDLIEAILDNERKLLEVKNKDRLFELQSMKETNRFDKEAVLIKARYEKRKEALAKQYSLSGPPVTPEQMALYEAYLKALGIEKDIRDYLLKKNEIARKNDKLRSDIQNKITNLSVKRANLEIEDPNNREALLALDKQILDLQIKQYKNLDRSLMSEKEKQDVNIRLKELYSDQIKLIEEQRRAADPLYDIWRHLREEVDDYADTLKNAGKNAIDSFANSMGDLVVSITEDNRTIGRSFRKMAKGIIDDINKMIIKWLIMKAIQAGIGAYGNYSAGMDTSGTGWSGSSSPEMSEFSHATGGVLPEIKSARAFASGGVVVGNITPVAKHTEKITSFKAFSSGGITNRPTLAVLGDNPTKKEIVIPQENIQSDYVSGYVRERGEAQNEVVVVNVLSEDDIYKVMAKEKGKRLVVNHIGRELESNSPSMRRVRGA